MADFTLTPLTPSPIGPIAPPASRHIFRWLIGLAIVLGVTSILLFYFGGSSFTESGVILTITGPNQASVGDEVVYKVHYENKTKTPLKNLKLSFAYPQGSAIIKDGQIVNNNGNVQTVDEEDLAPGASRDEEFKAFIVGEKGNIKVAVVKIIFDAGNLKSKFEKSAQFSTTISDTPIALTFIGPPTSTSGQSVTYVLDYRNQSQDEMSDLQLRMIYPDGFRVTKISPTATTGDNLWILPSLKTSSGARITIQGVLTGREGDSKAFEALLQRNINGAYIDYEKSVVTTVIASPLLSVDTTINGSSDYISHGGDKLQYTIRYTNTSNFTLSGLTLSAKLSGGIYDLSSIDTRGGFYDSSTGTINWNSTVVPAFNALVPRATGVVIFSVKLKQVSGSSSNNTLARATITLATDNVPDTIDTDRIVVIDDILTKVTSQPTFTQKMYYNDPSLGSSGPMPPRAGESTTFTIHWLVTNPGNNLSGTKIVATLPQGVTWKNIVNVSGSLPQPTFNKNTSQISWNIGSLPYGIGTAGTLPFELVFQVGVVPSSTQVGTQIPVITKATLSGIDSFTQQNIAVSNLDLSTSSTVDRPNEGLVQ